MQASNVWNTGPDVRDELLRAGESTSFKTRRGGRARRGRARASAHRATTARWGAELAGNRRNNSLDVDRLVVYYVSR